MNSQGAPYLVTEYLDGRTLKDEIDARGALPVNEAVTFTIELLKGLAVAHKAGIVHRDVKPSNLFVATTEAGRVLKILDFGIAKVLAQRTDDAPAPNLFPTAEGVMVGTPRFCSAEQALARPVDHRSDLYSASLVLYSMLTGRGPFDGKRTMADLLLAQAIEKPAAPSTFAAHVPATLDAVVLKALEKSPDARYASAAEFITALQAVTGSPLPRSVRQKCPSDHPRRTTTTPSVTPSPRQSSRPWNLPNGRRQQPTIRRSRPALRRASMRHHPWRPRS
ncbi:MAG: serine/threonine protein kinase [Polyangiaceae bacterium]|nr:serine/threonine protein kinase [Polyangiaceae bacterium]